VRLLFPSKALVGSIGVWGAGNGKYRRKGFLSKAFSAINSLAFSVIRGSTSTCLKSFPIGPVLQNSGSGEAGTVSILAAVILSFSI
jgi:hypothetical protein